MDSTDHRTSALLQRIAKFGFPFSIAEKSFGQRYGFLILTVVLISLIVGLATYARYNQNQNILMEQGMSLIQDWSPYPQTLSAKVEKQHASNIQIISEQQSEVQRKAMIAGITLLAIVFIIVQCVAVLLAYRHAFALDGGEDRLAYEKVRQYQLQNLEKGLSKTDLTSSQQMVVNKANLFFASYYSALNEQALKQSRIEIADTLRRRKAFDFSVFINNAIKEEER